MCRPVRLLAALGAVNALETAPTALLRRARGHQRVWVEGGGQLLRGMIAIGRLDRLEMAVLPLVLGDGVPLFPPGTAQTRLRLVLCRALDGGALHLVYDRIA